MESFFIRRTNFAPFGGQVSLAVAKSSVESLRNLLGEVIAEVLVKVFMGGP